MNKEQSGFGQLIIVGLITLLIVALAAGWYFRRQILTSPIPDQPIDYGNQTATQSASPSVSSPAHPVATSSANLLDTKNWKSFSDKKAGFAVRYPTDWYMKDCITGTAHNIYFDSTPVTNCANPMAQYIYIGTTTETLDNFRQDGQVYAKYYDIQETTVALKSGQKATQFILQKKDPTTPPPYTAVISTYIPNGSGAFVAIVDKLSVNNPALDTIYNAMVNSLTNP